MTESQVYKQIVENLSQIDDDIARLRHQALMLRVDIQILWEKYNEKSVLGSRPQITDDGVQHRFGGGNTGVGGPSIGWWADKP